MTAGVTAFLAARPNDPRLRPITVNDPLNSAAVFYIATIGENLALVNVRHALLPALANAAHFLSEDSNTPGLDWLEFHHEEGTKAKAIERVTKQLGANRLVEQRLLCLRTSVTGLCHNIGDSSGALGGDTSARCLRDEPSPAC